MASIRKRGSSYLIVVSMGYDYNGKRIKPQQKTVHPPEELTPRQVEKWLNEQAVLFERDCRHTPQPVQQLTLAKYIDLWLTDIAPGKLAKSTIRRDRQDIERILPALGHYKLTELRPEHFRNFYAELRKVIRPDTKKPLSEYTILMLSTRTKRQQARACRECWRFESHFRTHRSSGLADEDISGSFWNYIFLQYGFKSENSEAAANRLYNYFRGAIKGTLAHYKRFFAPEGTQQYYTSLLLHALAPKQSIESLYSILFDFYVKNLDFQYVTGYGDRKY